MYDIIRQMKDIAHVPIIAKPNAGIPFARRSNCLSYGLRNCR